ncbi:MAG: ABC transporter ATP-binding protein [Halanaerobiales bacterium]|nr:ABC transporter ATP-binding protein [Halanaerobiales bacterium]
MILKVTDLFFKYREREVLKDISFLIEKEQFLGIIGPNGSGKTTLIKNIAGFFRSQGKIVIKNENLSGLTKKEVAKRIGVVPQKSKLKGEFTVREIVEMGRYAYQTRFQRLKKEDDNVIEGVMRELDILKFHDRKINEVSGGEFQKVLIARALAQEPDILILDEATSNLDINRTIEIFQLARKICRENKITIIAIIHDLNMAAQFCDQIMVLKDGEKYQMGTPQEVLNPDLLYKTFGLKAQVITNPQNQRPYIIPYIEIDKI